MRLHPRLYAAAPAKLNLGLEILGRRPDGLHEIVTVIQAISLFDTFEWRQSGQPFSYVGMRGIAREHDLVAKALATADDFEQWTGTIRVFKRIPAAAGLGGGSSDAALALRLAAPDESQEELEARASNLGSDVPFFLTGGTAVARGTGTTVSAISSPNLWFVIVTPQLEIANKTATLYGGLADADFSSGDSVTAIAERLDAGAHPGTDLPNAFSRQLLSIPLVRYAYDRVTLAGGRVVSVTGAGPTVFTICDGWRDATSIVRRLPRDVGIVNIARTVGPARGAGSRRMAAALRGAV